jgi:hypothetical protein
MKNLTFYLIVIIVVLSGLVYTFYSLNKTNKNNSERWERNFNETSKDIQQINLSLSEFKKTLSNHNDSILELVNIKPKNVTQITNYNTFYTDTTISFILPEYEPKTGTYPFVDRSGCFEFSGFMELNDTIPELTIENRKFNSDFTEIEHYEKDTIHFIGLNFVKWWQNKRLTYTIVDNCSGEKRIKKFNVKK